MSTPQTAEYGFWKSPITSDLIVKEAVRLERIALEGDSIYWLEGRPAERGRGVIVRRSPDGGTLDVNSQPFNVRTRVHEYGGAAYTVSDGTVYFSNDSDQRLYAQKPGSDPIPITPEGAWRYADAVVDRKRQRLICVREDHTRPGKEAVNTLVAIDLSGERVTRLLMSGSDFYSNPRLSPDGSGLAWLSWNHPNMPWDGTELWAARIREDGALESPERVGGGETESIFQPEWSPEGSLYFVSDRRGWWNLYRHRNGKAEPLAEMDAEFGLPQWVLGHSTYAFESEGRLICAYTQKGVWRLAAIDTETGGFENIETPYTDISEVRASTGQVVFRGGSPTKPPSIVRIDLASGESQLIRRAFNIEPEIARCFSIPESIEFPTENGLTAHALFYEPHNPDFQPPPDERPPLIVVSHGGPTAATSSTLSRSIQYWTSRGFALLDVNYGGSTGYGREYRERLKGRWGVVDLDDCVNAALYMVKEGRADRERLIIKGGSAGGYTTLAALTFRDVFRAGASYYGVSDLEALARDTHKFESRYLDSIVGPYPEQRDIYRQRSPIHFVEQLSAPVIFFQGSEDKIVLPNQAEVMVEALRKKGVPVAYFLFDGEQHGFRRSENIKRALDAELYFYATMLLRKGLRF